MDDYEEYITGLKNLVNQGNPNQIRDVFYARLKGIKEPVHALISPPLYKNEPHETALLYDLYKQFKLEKNEKAIYECRRVIIDMIVHAFNIREEVHILTALSQLAGLFQVKYAEHLADELADRLWGFMYNKLGQPPGSKKITEMMLLNEHDIQYAWRALDLWVMLIPPFPQNSKAQCFKDIKELFDTSLKKFLPTMSRFQLLFISFLGVLKIDPLKAGKEGFLPVCNQIMKHEYFPDQEILRAAWLNLCWNIGAQFEFDETIGQLWKETFSSGLIGMNKRVKPGHIFWEALARMDNLYNELFYILSPQPQKREVTSENLSIKGYRSNLQLIEYKEKDLKVS